MSKTRSRPPRRKTPVRRRSVPSDAALRAMVRPIVREMVAREVEAIEDRLDYLESEASLADGEPVPAAAVWKAIGL